MVDYKVHLAKGVSAHQKASAAKEEVSAILRELTAQVEDFTNGRVGVSLKREGASLFGEVIGNLASVTSGLPSSPPLKVQYNLVAYDKSGGTGSAERLASWTQANTGYPCTLRFDDAKREAYDRKSLESILGELLASPETGRIISAIASKAPRAIGEAASD